MSEKLKTNRYAKIILQNASLRDHIEAGVFTLDDVKRAAEKVAEVRSDVLVPGGPRTTVGQYEVYDHAALRFGQTEVNTSERRARVLLENMARDTDPKRIFFIKSRKHQV